MMNLLFRNTDFLLAYSELGLSDVLEAAGVWVCNPVRRTGGRAPREGAANNQRGSALSALDAELVLIELRMD